MQWAFCGMRCLKKKTGRWYITAQTDLSTERPKNAVGELQKGEVWARINEASPFCPAIIVNKDK